MTPMLPQIPDALVPEQVPLAGLQLIEASAGTGKTWNICVLYLRLLLERRLTVQEILVVTFTKAATAELKDRIRTRLAELLAGLEGLLAGMPDTASDPASPAPMAPLLLTLVEQAQQLTGASLAELHTRIGLALHTFDEAAIFTIHGFCQRALGDAPFVAGVPLQFELLQDDEALRLEVVQDVWRQQLASSPPSDRLAQELVRQRLDPAAVARILQKQLAKPLARVVWPAGLDEPDPDESGQHAGLLAIWAELGALWSADATRIHGQVLACREGLNQKSHSAAALDQARQDWAALLAGGDPLASLAAGKHALYRLDRLKLTAGGVKRGLSAPTHRFFACVADYLDARKALEVSLRVQRLRWLRSLLGQARAQLARRKTELRVQAFDDLLAGLYRALDAPDAGALIDHLQARFPVALVDEFQDTDPQQLAILERLYANRHGVLFLVGDPKQAIYSFRNADLRTYLHARAKASAVWTLARNQRSGAALIAALNGLFTQNPRAFLLDGLDYRALRSGDKVIAPLVERPVDGHAAPAALQVWLLPQDEGGLPLSSRASMPLVEERVVDEIVRLIAGGQRGTVRLGRQALGARDIAVLVRSHAEGRRMREALRSRGVASVELSQEDIFSSSDAEEVLRVLHGVADPLREGRVCAALGTDLLGWSALELVDLRQDESRLAQRMEAFELALQRWRRRGFGLMFRRLLDDYQVASRLLSRPDGARRLTNIRHLAELLHEASLTHDSPAALLQWLEQKIQLPADDEVQQLRLESDAHLVQIVTIHAAKGLEYPVVFCVDLWKSARVRGGHAGVLHEYHAADGATVLDYRNEDELKQSGEYGAITEEQRREHFAEQLRLIYVALTRASARCYLVAGAYDSGRNSPVGQPARNPPSTREAGRSALNWLSGSGSGDWDAWLRAERDASEIEQSWFVLQQRVADPASLAVCRLPASAGRRLDSPVTDPARLRAQTPPGPLPPRRRISSYSAIVQGAGQALYVQATPTVATVPAVSAASAVEATLFGEALGRDHDALTVRSDAPPATASADAMKDEDGDGDAAAVPDDDIFHFPRGSLAGTCLHAVLEHTDFANPAGWPAAVARALATHAPLLEGAEQRGRQRQWRGMLLQWLQHISAVRMPFGARLADLDPRRRLHELEFHLPAPGLHPAALAAVLRRHHFKRFEFHFEPVYGYLKGFIDLVFEHEGRWYVLDWKSNHLGSRQQDYDPASLQAEMERHDYELQALLYLLVLHRFLQCRLLDYQPDQHLGGALYLFVRGIRPAWREEGATAPGVWFLRPQITVLDDLAAALSGRAPVHDVEAASP